MKHTCKTLLTYLSIFLFIFLAKTSFAQYPGMAAFRAQQSRQFANQQMNTMMQMNALRGANYSYNEKYTFIVTMKDSTKKEVRSRIYTDTTTNRNYLLLEDKNFKKSDTNRYKKIYPSQTISIARDMPVVTNTVHAGAFAHVSSYYTGKATDSCWMFKAITGRITAYSYLSEEDGQLFDPSSIVGIQLNDGPIVSFNENNLKQMIGQDDVNALQIIQNKNYLRAIKRYNRDMKKADKK